MTSDFKLFYSFLCYYLSNFINNYKNIFSLNQNFHYFMDLIIKIIILIAKIKLNL